MRLICCCIVGLTIFSSLIFITKPAECKMGGLGSGMKMSGENKNITTMTEIAKTYMDVIAAALHYYNLDNGMYPTTKQGLEALVKKPTLPPIPSKWRGPYLGKIPLDSWGNPYNYVCPGAHNKNSYDLSSSQDLVNNWDHSK